MTSQGFKITTGSLIFFSNVKEWKEPIQLKLSYVRYVRSTVHDQESARSLRCSYSKIPKNLKCAQTTVSLSDPGVNKACDLCSSSGSLSSS